MNTYNSHVKFSFKISQMFCDFFGYFENITFIKKLPWLLFWGNFRKNGNFFVRMSGHTGLEILAESDVMQQQQ